MKMFSGKIYRESEIGLIKDDEFLPDRDEMMFEH